jgi:hypothetical protein
VKIRVTIRAMVGLIFVVGFALAAFRQANIGWAVASVLAALMVLCFATLNALVRRDHSLPVWLGFALWLGLLPASLWTLGQLEDRVRPGPVHNLGGGRRGPALGGPGTR